MDQTESWKRTNVITTRFSEIASALRASLYKQGERNLLKNITDGVGYEGIIECWEIGATGGNYAGNVYDKNYLAPAINTCQGGYREPMIIIKHERQSD